MGKKIICIAAMLMFTGGCVQKQENGQGIAGRVAINVNVDKVFDLAKDKSKKDKEKSKDEKKTDSTEKETEEKQTANSNQSATAKQSTEKNSTSKQSDTSQATQPSQSNENKVNSEDSKHSSSSSSKEQTKQDISHTQGNEPTNTFEPVKPIEPEPSVPACDDTIPTGAYPIEQESEIDALVQAEMTENQAYGDGTFTQYKTEYGQTECGTKYFYIIRIYS